MPNIVIHGQGGESYNRDRPIITADVSYSAVRRNGSTVSVDVYLNVHGLGGQSFFGYNLDIYTRIEGGNWLFLCSKGNNPMQWADGAIYGSGTPSATNTSTSCKLQIGLSSVCGCHQGAPILPVYSVVLPAPASGYTVTFKSYTGTVLKTQQVAKGGNATPPPHPNRTGYTPNGWSGSYTNVQADQICIAQYIRNRYTVKYNLAGGTGDFPNQIKYGEQAMQLPPNSPTYTVTITLDGNGGVGTTKTAYRTFLGWRCSADSKLYFMGDYYYLNASCTMVAEWATVVINISQIEPSEYKKSKLTINWMDRVVTIKEEMRYHSFLGWFTDPVSGEQITSVQTESNRRVYAHWGDVKILPVQVLPSKANWNFIDFYADSAYTPSRRITSSSVMSSSITIYAKWSYNVRIYGNGGNLWLPTFPNVDGVISSKSVDTLVKQHGSPLAFPDYTIDFNTAASGGEVVDKEGQSKEFVGWNSRADGSGVSYPKLYVYEVNDSAQFYAKWKTKNFKVVFIDGYRAGNEGIIATFIVPYGGSVSKAQVDALTVPKRDGYSFSGWRGSYTNVQSDVTVVAAWNFSPIWIYVADGFGGHWQGYEPKE